MITEYCNNTVLINKNHYLLLYEGIRVYNYKLIQ